MTSFLWRRAIGTRIGALLRAAAAAIPRRRGREQRVLQRMPRLSREWLRRQAREAAKHDAA